MFAIRLSARLHAVLMIFIALGTSSIAGQPAVSNYKTVEDLLYRESGASDELMKEFCRLDIYYPENTKGFSTVVWFHSGGLTSGKRSIPPRLKDQGIAVVAVDYRLSPSVKTAQCLEDAAAAVAWVYRHIEEYGGSKERIYVAGHSAGGYLTLMLGLDKRWLNAVGLEPSSLAGLISLSGQTITHLTTRAERGIPDKQPIVDDMAPLYFVNKDVSPVLLVTGDRDLEMLGRYEENAYFWRMMKVAGHTDITLREVQGFDHGNMWGPGCELLARWVQDHSKK